MAKLEKTAEIKKVMSEMMLVRRYVCTYCSITVYFARLYE